MTYRFGQLMFTPLVRDLQARMGSRQAYARQETPEAPARDRFTDAERDFIHARDSFYMASVSETGWPYVQHRGGPERFLRVLDERTLAFADFKGNRQYVSLGNFAHDDRVALFLMDYPRRRRMKILGHIRVVSEQEDPALIERLRDTDYGATIERAFVITIEAFDWNCPQHITPRFTEREIAQATAPLLERLRGLEEERERLRAEVGRLREEARRLSDGDTQQE